MIPLRDLNPGRRTPVVTIALIAVNALLFGYELMLGSGLDGFLMQSAFIPSRLFSEGPGGGWGYGASSALLSMFLHGGWMHFLGNMLFLWIFGDNVEDRLGRLNYLFFYLGCGYAATLSHALVDANSGVPTIGASGAIAGVLGAYVVLYPRARVLTLIFLGFFIQTVEIPAFLYLGFWFVLQFFSGIASLGHHGAGQGGVAFFAHIGGFIAGPILLWVFSGRREEPPPGPSRSGRPVPWS